MRNHRKKKSPDGRGANRINKASRHRLAGEVLFELYPNQREYEADMGLLETAWVKHYGPLPDDFVPPFFYTDTDDGLKVVEWPGTFRDLLLEKYGLAESALVERRFTYMFNLFLMEATTRVIQPSIQHG